MKSSEGNNRWLSLVVSYNTPDVAADFAYDNLGRFMGIDYGQSVVKFGYTYWPGENNIRRKTFDHRAGAPYNEYAYDNLDRLTQADYLVGLLTEDEVFGMDDLGNRTTVNLRSGVDQVYTADSLTNRYTAVDSQSQTYDAAGNLTQDHEGYHYVYDYENRVTRIYRMNGQTEIDVAQYVYDALGRRIRKSDESAQSVVLYYYNPDWQVLAEYDGADSLRRCFVYGNYIDEPLVMSDGTNDYYYAQDHLYSTAALLDDAGNVVERCEYDAYGTAHITDASYTARTASAYGNAYTFTGRQVDILDGGALKIQYNRNRYYDYDTGRWTTQDPLGVRPWGAKWQRPFFAALQYSDGLNLYQYAQSSPWTKNDPMGLIPGADGDVGYGWTPERCEQLRERRSIELGSDLVRCAAASAGPISRDTALCVGACALASLPSGESAFKPCLAGCTGISAAIEMYVLARCMELQNFHRQSIERSYNYCMCRADCGSSGDCLHHLDYDPPRRGMGRRIIDRIAGFLVQ